jgi:hypothetical protein
LALFPGPWNCSRPALKTGLLCQKAPQTPTQLGNLFRFALPYDKRVPSKLFEFLPVLFVALHIPLQLWKPVLGSRIRDEGITAIRMLVPEASVYKDDLTAFVKHDIRCSWQTSDVQPIPIPHPGEQPPDKKLWLGVLGSDTAHQKTSLDASQPVHILFPVFVHGFTGLAS